MQNVAVTTEVTEALPAANRGAMLLLQNQSDTTLRLAFGGACIYLSATVGLKLEPGETIPVDSTPGSRRICAIHGGTGPKILHWQEV